MITRGPLSLKSLYVNYFQEDLISKNCFEVSGPRVLRPTGVVYREAFLAWLFSNLGVICHGENYNV